MSHSSVAATSPAPAPDAPDERKTSDAAVRIVARATQVQIACSTATGIARDATIGALSTLSPDELAQECDRLLSALGNASPEPDVQARLDAIDREIAGRSDTVRPVVDPGADYPATLA